MKILFSGTGYTAPLPSDGLPVSRASRSCGSMSSNSSSRFSADITGGLRCGASLWPIIVTNLDMA